MARLTAQRLARVALVAFFEGHCCCGADNRVEVSFMRSTGWKQAMNEATRPLECLTFDQVSRHIFGDISLGVGRVRAVSFYSDDNDSRTARCVRRDARDNFYNTPYV
jgi:hypothetical protein